MTLRAQFSLGFSLLALVALAGCDKAKPEASSAEAMTKTAAAPATLPSSGNADAKMEAQNQSGAAGAVLADTGMPPPGMSMRPTESAKAAVANAPMALQKRAATRAFAKGAVPGGAMMGGGMARGNAMLAEREERASGEGYERIVENGFQDVAQHPDSTFSIDVDTASYSNVRRFLREGQLPPKDAVRIEELINYFKYDYPQPQGAIPFTVNLDHSLAPWNPEHELVLIGVQGKAIATEHLPPSNLVFLIDVSGSMAEPDKLPLLVSAFKMLARQLRPVDRVSIVVYAGAAGLVLPPTPGNERSKILDALDRLEAGGSTAGGEGIELAYQVAQKTFLPRGNNRVILATDGDFNVGVSSDEALVKLIEKKRQSGVFLSVLSVGTGNLQDSKMEKLADKGNGNYAYIDSQLEANKVFVQQLGGTLNTIAKDVKLQVAFNPDRVKSYRLVGYENRTLAHEDFSNDKKDAGELGAGHTVTALYELIPKPGANGSALRSVQLRYKEPKASQSQLISAVLPTGGHPLELASANLQFAAAVAEFGFLLRDSVHQGKASFTQVRTLASRAKGADLEGYRAEFIGLVGRAEKLKQRH